VLSIASPALICQVDEHTLDLLVLTPDGTVITRRVHGAVLICVKTAAILGAVLSLDSLKEEDYMRLVKMAIEPKDRITALYECQHPWPCSGKPAVIFHDRGKIFTSERATQVLVDRLGITTEQAPPYAPSAKGTVEALFTWVTRKFTHRLPGTTKATPADRGTYDSVSEAQKAGMTLDVLEKLFIQAIVDAYMQEWDHLRRGRRASLWEDSVQQKGVPRYLGSPDDLKLLLMKAQNRKNPMTGRYAITQSKLSFLGRTYVSPGLLDRLRGKEIDIYYDRRDISAIYLFLEGELVGEAYCTELLGQPMSIWEAQARRKADTEQAKEASTISLENRQRIQQEAASGRRALSLETRRLEKQRLLEQQRPEIHPDHVQAALRVLAHQQSISPPPPPQPTGLLPPAVPEDDTPTTPIVRLQIRKRRSDDG
jgi:putative transposase